MYNTKDPRLQLKAGMGKHFRICDHHRLIASVDVAARPRLSSRKTLPPVPMRFGQPGMRRDRIALQSHKKKCYPGMDGSRAFRIAVEDGETAHFMRAHFSLPEERPEIIIEKWVIRNRGKLRWRVAILEKPDLALLPRRPMVNLALVDVDAVSGRVLHRKYMRNILMEEFQKFIRNA